MSRLQICTSPSSLCPVRTHHLNTVFWVWGLGFRFTGLVDFTSSLMYSEFRLIRMYGLGQGLGRRSRALSAATLIEHRSSDAKVILMTRISWIHSEIILPLEPSHYLLVFVTNQHLSYPTMTRLERFLIIISGNH